MFSEVLNNIYNLKHLLFLVIYKTYIHDAPSKAFYFFLSYYVKNYTDLPTKYEQVTHFFCVHKLTCTRIITMCKIQSHSK